MSYGERKASLSVEPFACSWRHSQPIVNLGPTTNPPTTRAVTCRAKVYRGPMSVLLCVSFLFPDEAGLRECLSQDRRVPIVNASDSPALHRRLDSYRTCAASHMWDPVPWLTTLPQDSEETDADEESEDCLPQHQVQRLSCEATTFEPQGARRAQVTRANDHPHQVAATARASSSRRATK